MVLNHWSRRCDLVGRISGTSFFIVMSVIIKSSPETIKQIRYLLNYEVSNTHSSTVMRPRRGAYLIKLIQAIDVIGQGLTIIVLLRLCDDEIRVCATVNIVKRTIF